uniref:Uncharacterized protein n=1 Tax=Arundo donax TaxID=35708 RepID=A0A0A9BRB8_ARUDO
MLWLLVCASTWMYSARGEGLVM